MSEIVDKINYNLPVELRELVVEQFINKLPHLYVLAKWQVELKVCESLNYLFPKEQLLADFKFYQGDIPYRGEELVPESLCIGSFKLKKDTIDRINNIFDRKDMPLRAFIPYVHLAVIDEDLYFYLSAFDRNSVYTPLEKWIHRKADSNDVTLDEAYEEIRNELFHRVKKFAKRLDLETNVIQKSGRSAQMNTLDNPYRYSSFDKPQKIADLRKELWVLIKDTVPWESLGEVSSYVTTTL